MAAKFDGFAKSRHPRAGGNPESAKGLKRLAPRFHGNDGKEPLLNTKVLTTFRGFVKEFIPGVLSSPLSFPENSRIPRN
jgi:hypothetical protein